MNGLLVTVHLGVASTTRFVLPARAASDSDAARKCIDAAAVHFTNAGFAAGEQALETCRECLTRALFWNIGVTKPGRSATWALSTTAQVTCTRCCDQVAAHAPSCTKARL
jgi:hypothetical protein